MGRCRGRGRSPAHWEVTSSVPLSCHSGFVVLRRCDVRKACCVRDHGVR